MAKRVLAVAGREGIAPALQVQIELWGDSLEFTLAASGNEALWEIRGSPYDLVLAPWQLPEMNGMEFAEVVQALSPATKVVLIGVPTVTPPMQSQAERLHLFALLPEVMPQDVAAVISRALGVSLPRPKPAPLPPSPPPREETPTPTPPAARAKPAVVPAAKVPPQPAPPPTPKVTLTKAQSDAVRRALRDIVASVGPQVAFLASASGDPLVVDGNPGDLPLPAVAAQAAAGLAGLGDLARLLSEEKFLGLSLFNGARYDVYVFTITETASLFLIFDKRIVESKLGSVWLYTRRVVDDLSKALA
jgi:CheY-like chemotaxis protein